MKQTALLLLSIFLCSCTSFYVEPELAGNEAVLSIVADEPFEFNAPFGMLIEAELDGKLIHSYKYPNLKTFISPGKHRLAVSLNAYYYNRAKHHFTKEYEIDFKPNETYVIRSQVDSKTIDKLKDNMPAEFSINGSGVNIKEKVLLKDSAMRSAACQIPDCTFQFIIIQ